MLPSYLNELIPLAIGQTGIYDFRNNRNLPPIGSSKNCVLRSFIPSAIRTWNLTDNEIKTAQSLASFKSKLKASKGYPFIRLNLYGNSYGHICLSRIKLGLSGLNSHRHKFRFIPNNLCPTCGMRNENPVHYFFDCPTYTAQRVQMLHLLNNCLTDDNKYLLNYRNNNEKKILLKMLLNFEEGKTEIIDILASFIIETQRFI